MVKGIYLQCIALYTPYGSQSTLESLTFTYLETYLLNYSVGYSLSRYNFFILFSLKWLTLTVTSLRGQRYNSGQFLHLLMLYINTHCFRTAA